MNIKCLISPATQVRAQKLIQNLYRLTTINSWKISIVGPLWWESTGNLWESAGNPESASTSWHHHEDLCWLMESGTPWNWLQLTLKVKYTNFHSGKYWYTQQTMLFHKHTKTHTTRDNPNIYYSFLYFISQLLRLKGDQRILCIRSKHSSLC